MARYTEARCRQCRREGQKLFLKGDRCTTKKCAMDRYPAPPGQHGLSRKKPSEHQLQLREKQKVKRMYGVLEKQFRAYYTEAARRKGVTGVNMLMLLEKRLDNVVYRMGIAPSRAQARQLVNHGHFLVNGKAVNIPSYSLKLGDSVSVKPVKRGNEFFKELKDAKVQPPKWLTFDTSSFEGKVILAPEREDISMNINEQSIVELYSK